MTSHTYKNLWGYRQLDNLNIGLLILLFLLLGLCNLIIFFAWLFIPETSINSILEQGFPNERAIKWVGKFDNSDLNAQWIIQGNLIAIVIWAGFVYTNWIENSLIELSASDPQIVDTLTKFALKPRVIFLVAGLIFFL